MLVVFFSLARYLQYRLYITKIITIMEKIDYKKGKFNILSNRVNVEAFDYRDYEEWCEANYIEPKGKESSDFYDWCKTGVEEIFESDLDNIGGEESYNIPTIIEGSLGLWKGRCEIEPIECNSVIQAIKKCLRGDYMKLIDVEYDNGRINVTICHHDGTNCFTIRPKDKRRKFKYLYAI